MRIMVPAGSNYIRAACADYPDHAGILLGPWIGNDPLALSKYGVPVASDNGCFSKADFGAMWRYYLRIKPFVNPVWCTAPDRPFDCDGTLSLFYAWAPVMRSYGLRIAYVAQNGAEDKPLPQCDCVFLGGDTAWKLSPHAARVAKLAREQGRWVHMGRVNSLRRLRIAYEFGCDSVDGLSYARFSKTHLRRALRYVQAMDTIRRLW